MKHAGGAALHRKIATSHLPTPREMVINARSRENKSNEQQTNTARIRRHRARYRTRLGLARAVRLGGREKIRSGFQRNRNQARTNRSAVRSRLDLWRVGAR